MMTQTTTPLSTGRAGDSAPDSVVRQLIGRITRLEIIVGAAIGWVHVEAQHKMVLQQKLSARMLRDAEHRMGVAKQGNRQVI